MFYVVTLRTKSLNDQWPQLAFCCQLHHGDPWQSISSLWQPLAGHIALGLFLLLFIMMPGPVRTCCALKEVISPRWCDWDWVRPRHCAITPEVAVLPEQCRGCLSHLVLPRKLNLLLSAGDVQRRGPQPLGALLVAICWPPAHCCTLRASQDLTRTSQGPVIRGSPASSVLLWPSIATMNDQGSAVLWFLGSRWFLVSIVTSYGTNIFSDCWFFDYRCNITKFCLLILHLSWIYNAWKFLIRSV